MAIKLKSWNEDNLNKIEEMIVIIPARIKSAGDEVAKRYDYGEKVKISGIEKKDIYFRNIVCYPEDFEKIDADKKAKLTIEADGKSSDNLKKK